MNENLDFNLYHGTDARIISMSETERCEYLSNCQKVIDYLWDTYKPYFLTYEDVETELNGNKAYVSRSKLEIYYKNYITERSDENLWLNILDKLIILQIKEIGNQQYQYGDLYLTGDKNKAINYANSSFAGGEIGLIAYRLLQGAEILGWIDADKQSDIYELIGKIKLFATSDPKPVVLKVKDIDVDKLLLDNGRPLKPIDFTMMDCLSLRYTGDYDLSNSNVEYVSLEYDEDGSPCLF